jgi:3-phenylpropionate/cinnamic acid dioxygenase small subunit
MGRGAELRDLRLEIEDFNTEYAVVLDAGRVADWPGFFTEDAIYRITGRENWDANLPVGLVYCEGMGMLRDRALAIAKTTMFAPRYLMHQISNTRVLSVDPSGLIAAEANYALYETLVDERTTLQQVGRYHDKFARDGGRLLLKERHCVYDSVIIDTALIYPV